MTKKLNIRAIRKQLKLTQQGLATMLGVSMSTVANWEAGRSEPSALARRALSDIQLDHLLRKEAD